MALLALGVVGTSCGGEPDQIQVRAYAVQGTDDRQLFLVFPWERDGICVGQFSADVRETPTVVTVSKIKNSYDGGDCAGLGRMVSALISWWSCVHRLGPAACRRLRVGPWSAFRLPSGGYPSARSTSARVAKPRYLR